jgi:hypothetical protein
MTLYRDYAIITIDDDIGYAKDTFESLFNAYIDNPNIISGRRTHLMTFKRNGELRGYFEWKFQQKLINETNFNLILTNCGGSIFPPDILNINESSLDNLIPKKGRITSEEWNEILDNVYNKNKIYLGLNRVV